MPQFAPGCAPRAMVPIEVLGVQIEPGSGMPLVLLREAEGAGRLLPVFIGGTEAMAIAMSLQGVVTPRPLTHDLLVDVLASTDTHVDTVTITEVRDGTFFAEVALRGPTGSRVLTSRPSDAIAIAVRLGAPLFAEADVLDAAAVAPEAVEAGEDDDVDVETLVSEFRSFLDEIGPGDFGTEG